MKAGESEAHQQVNWRKIPISLIDPAGAERPFGGVSVIA
jgi:hypothetical protein